MRTRMRLFMRLFNSIAARRDACECSMSANMGMFQSCHVLRRGALLMRVSRAEEKKMIYTQHDCCSRLNLPASTKQYKPQSDVRTISYTNTKNTACAGQIGRGLCLRPSHQLECPKMVRMSCCYSVRWFRYYTQQARQPAAPTPNVCDNLHDNVKFDHCVGIILGPYTIQWCRVCTEILDQHAPPTKVVNR